MLYLSSESFIQFALILFTCSPNFSHVYTHSLSTQLWICVLDRSNPICAVHPFLDTESSSGTYGAWTPCQGLCSQQNRTLSQLLSNAISMLELLLTRACTYFHAGAIAMSGSAVFARQCIFILIFLQDLGFLSLVYNDPRILEGRHGMDVPYRATHSLFSHSLYIRGL